MTEEQIAILADIEIYATVTAATLSVRLRSPRLANQSQQVTKAIL